MWHPIKVGIDYLYRTARLEPIRSNGADTAVVFTHGILSETSAAFALHGRDGYFWDLLMHRRPYSAFDFFKFSYGRIDPSYLLKLEDPVSTLVRIAHKLHAALLEYKNVILIGHSQGGLLAKTYASLFNRHQGVFLITLHTPHQNTSFSVMRFNNQAIWDDGARYVVPHIFCASINDNLIVSPEDAVLGCVDPAYISHDDSKRHLGHSHLSQSPDSRLCRLIDDGVFGFTNSGLNNAVLMLLSNPIRARGARYRFELLHSRSPSRLDRGAACNQDGVLADIWRRDLFAYSQANVDEWYRSLPVAPGTRDVTIKFNGTSINYFLRYLTNYGLPTEHISRHDLDEDSGESRAASNDLLCEEAFDRPVVGDNPYDQLPFDIADFGRKSLVIDQEFMKVFVGVLRESGFSIRSGMADGTYKKRLLRHFSAAVRKYRRILSASIHVDIGGRVQIGKERFCDVLTRAVRRVAGLKQTKCRYQEIFNAIRREFISEATSIGIVAVECIVSRTMKSDGEVYWLDRHIEEIFSKRHDHISDDVDSETG